MPRQTLSPLTNKVVTVLGQDGDFLLVEDTPPNDRIWIGYAVNPISEAEPVSEPASAEWVEE